MAIDIPVAEFSFLFRTLDLMTSMCRGRGLGQMHEDTEMKNVNRPLQSPARYLAGVCLGLALAIGYSITASALDLPPQERADVALVHDFFAALDASEARGDQSTAIVDIVNKYLAKDFVQHMGSNTRDRDTWMASFQRRGAIPQASSNSARLPPSREFAIMTDGRYVIRISTRDGITLFWHMLRVVDGKLAEEWQPAGLAGAGSPAVAGPPAAAPRQ
jgi:hypothetical protein